MLPDRLADGPPTVTLPMCAETTAEGEGASTDPGHQGEEATSTNRCAVPSSPGSEGRGVAHGCRRRLGSGSQEAAMAPEGAAAATDDSMCQGILARAWVGAGGTR